MDIHIERMLRCVVLAQKAIGYQKTNPLVGCSVYENNKLIAEGWHPYFGGPHAEVVALDQCPPQRNEYRQLYVTLEPCTHFGKTPPCANRIISEGINEVHIGIQDPNPLVSGKGISMLMDANIKVYRYDHIPAFAQLIRPFAMSLTLKRPYIILKWAESKDGFIGRHNLSVKLSNIFSDRKVHILRNKVDMIFVANRTIQTDNPALTSRVPPFKNPAVLCMNLNGTAPEAWVDNKLKNSDFYYVSHRQDSLANKLNLKNVLYLDSVHYDTHNWNKTLSWLHVNNIGTLLVEGGSQVLHFLIQNNLWDEAIVIKTEKRLNSGISAPEIIGNTFTTEKINDDQWIYYINDDKNHNHPYAKTI
jgi:diaminohydroxyphosphoribosylaminopyrimidine deaminase / 5-amino-6-(5-phosphoribosylamino)uracil reductase